MSSFKNSTQHPLILEYKPVSQHTTIGETNFIALSDCEPENSSLQVVRNSLLSDNPTKQSSIKDQYTVKQLDNADPSFLDMN